MWNDCGEVFDAVMSGEGLEYTDLGDTTEWDDTYTEWDEAVRETLSDIGFKVDEYDEEEPRGHELACIAYHTASGAGVGLWEEEFAEFLPAGGYEPVKSALIALWGGEWETRLHNAAWENARNDADPVVGAVLVDGVGMERPDYDASFDVHVSLNEDGCHKNPLANLAWVNSAGVDVRAESDVVSVSISVGDPRGAFVMRVERMSDGEIRLSVPHPDDSLPHMTLTPLASPGYYKVGE